MDLVVDGRSPQLCHDVMYLLSRVGPMPHHRSADIPIGSEKKPGTKARPESSSIQSMKTGEGWDLQLDQAAIWNGL